MTTLIGNQSSAYALVIQSDTKIVVAGVSNGSIALARYTTAGALDTTFNSGGSVPGTVTTTISGIDAAFGVALQSDNKIVIAGISNGRLCLRDILMMV